MWTEPLANSIQILYNISLTYRHLGKVSQLLNCYMIGHWPLIKIVNFLIRIKLAKIEINLKASYKLVAVSKRCNKQMGRCCFSEWKCSHGVRTVTDN